MLILINQCLLNVVQHDTSIEWSKFPQVKFPFPHLSILLAKTVFVLMLVFLFLPIPFLFQTFQEQPVSNFAFRI